MSEIKPENLKYYRKHRKQKRNKLDSPFVRLILNIPKSLAVTLNREADARGETVNRLACIAIDNELDQSNAFNYPIDFPDTPYVEFAYSSEAIKMLDYLRKFPNGIQVKFLILDRRAYTVPDRDTALHAYRELFNTKMVEEFAPTSHFGRTLPSNIRYTRIRERSVERVRRAPNRISRDAAIKREQELRQLEKQGVGREDLPDYSDEVDEET